MGDIADDMSDGVEEVPVWNLDGKHKPAKKLLFNLNTGKGPSLNHPLRYYWEEIQIKVMYRTPKAVQVKLLDNSIHWLPFLAIRFPVLVPVTGKSYIVAIRGDWAENKGII